VELVLRRLDTFIVDELVPAPRGVLNIEVTFDIDSNGILDVTAKDLATTNSQSIHVTGATRLSSDEKERMVKEAACGTRGYRLHR
jgi:molecular chaperone DnaK